MINENHLVPVSANIRCVECADTLYCATSTGLRSEHRNYKGYGGSLTTLTPQYRFPVRL